MAVYQARFHHKVVGNDRHFFAIKPLQWRHGVLAEVDIGGGKKGVCHGVCCLRQVFRLSSNRNITMRLT